jgi:RHH-type transcriptional regulator, proline utilization regulon repressor / proline dehydrogenase / delta 1-pyrroline-5-carboxylate dehydrogenase
MTRRASDRRMIDRETSRLARRMAELGADHRSRLFHLPRWTERVMQWAMDRPAFKTQLFRFVDAFPAMADHRDVARHVTEYFATSGDGAAETGEGAPWALRRGIGAAGKLPLGTRVEASVARRNIERMARQFIAGATPTEAVGGLAELWRSGSAFTVDVLGEKTLTTPEADRYAARVGELLTVLTDAAASWPPDERLERDDLGSPLPRVNLSVKPTALAPHFGPLTRELGMAEGKARLREILRHAAAAGAFVNLDMEHYEVKDLTLELFTDVLSEDEFCDQEAGIVIQAYLRDAQHDLAELIAWSSQRSRPVTIRLVKGAYWDTETVISGAQDWPAPVYERKVETDANYERCVRMLHDHHGEVGAAFGSHNLRSLAYAVTYARHRGIPDNGYEIQTLYGMGEPIQAAMRALGLRSRVYAPVGELVPGMAYLVRRLLENTSNESFLRHRVVEGRALEELLRPPSVASLPGPAPARSRPATEPADPAPYLPEPPIEWRQRGERARFGAAIDAMAAQGLGTEVPALIDGEEVRTARTIRSLDPAVPEELVAVSASCGRDEADQAVAAARRVAETWRSTPARERAAVLFRAAAWLRERRVEIAALECFEAGKPWDQADVDVCEAIDFCEYYGREMLRLDGAAADRVQSPPGEANRLLYQGKGVAAVIAPWNFPLAIPTGMTTAALVAGNPVILKPAEQTPLVARYLIDALRAAGAPPGVVQFLPGRGEEVGAALVAHPDVAVIAFTGSKAVGLEINQQAAVPLEGQRHVKRVVAEMGGKNALIVDADADPDEAVPAAAVSAFGYAGQKCSAASRLVVLDGVYDQIIDRLVRYTAELVVGHPRKPETQVGPLIDGEAHERVLGWVDKAASSGRVRLQRDDVPEAGFFVGPTIVEVDDLRSPVVREEIFGPLLAVLRARDLDEAIAVANDTDYALTAGICSRSPAAIRKASAELRAGNVYVNRAITGSVVGRQPFGGYGLSGVGSKAGGPDYLLQFLDPRTVTENTVRQGFAPEV